MEGLIGSLNKDKWEEISMADKKGEYIEFHIMRPHKQVNPSTFAFMVETDNIDPKMVTLEHAKDDPIKRIERCEFRLSDDGTKIIGMDLDGDVVVLKS